MSVKTTQRWVEALPSMSEYDMHHALVEGLERFNGDVRGDPVKRIKMLKVMEETALSAQFRIVDEYVDTAENNHSARQALWREAKLFWAQMGTAYLNFLKLILNNHQGEGLRAWNVEIIFRNLYYTAMAMGWEYFKGTRPSELAWRRLHRIYRSAEIAGVALTEIEVGGQQTNCAREYVLALLLEMANSHVYKPREIRLMKQILGDLDNLPIPEIGLKRDRHSHMIDLTTSLGAETIEDGWVPGKRLRYLELQSVVRELENRATTADNLQISLLCRQMARVVGRDGARRDSQRRAVTGEIYVASGIDAVLQVMSGKTEGVIESWTLHDESRQGLGFVLPDGKVVPSGSLLVASRVPHERKWQLLVVRWERGENGTNSVGAESLSKHPKLVEAVWKVPGGEDIEKLPAIFLPLADTTKGIASNLLIPLSCYEIGRVLSLRGDNINYRLALGEIVESHENWLRVGFDVLAREPGAA